MEPMHGTIKPGELKYWIVALILTAATAFYFVAGTNKATSQEPFRLEKIGSYGSFEYKTDVLRDNQTGCQYLVSYIKNAAITSTPMYTGTALGPVVKC